MRNEEYIQHLEEIMKNVEALNLRELYQITLEIPKGDLDDVLEALEGLIPYARVKYIKDSQLLNEYTEIL